TDKQEQHPLPTDEDAATTDEPSSCYCGLKWVLTRVDMEHMKDIRSVKDYPRIPRRSLMRPKF
ncbi:unnamed protein product, partial [Amoebophrya sp. A25]